MSSPVEYVLEDGVGRLTLNRPDVFNALSVDLLDALQEHVDQAVHDDAVGSLLITGAGRAFCAGGDVAGLAGLARSERPQADLHEGVGRMHRALVSLFRCPKPVVAAVNGATAGAGLGLMMTADLIWAGKASHFTLAFTAIGASPDGGTTFLLPRLVGPKVASELLLTNRRLSAEEALAAGLITRVLDDEALLSEALATARCLAAGPRNAYASAKALLRRSLLQGYESQLEAERDGIVAAAVGAEFREGVQAFLEKRAPQF